MLENTGGEINNGQSRETGNISRILMTKKTKTQPNMCCTPLYATTKTQK